MYYYLTQGLFWLYWLIVLIAGAFIVRETFRSTNWTTQAGAALALIPLLLRVLLIK